MADVGKRRAPPALRTVLDADVKLTKTFVMWVNRYLPLETFRVYYKGLEISCHGIPWLAFWIAFTWLFNNPSYVQLQVNMLFGLLLDIILVAVAKAYFRRRRPRTNADDALGQMGPDIFSFPSGHASRAVFVTYFFISLYPVSIVFVPLLLNWTIAICITRVLMNRHYILDVIGGIILGILDGLLMTLFWVQDDTAKSIMSYLSDEKLDGGEYHV